MKNTHAALARHEVHCSICRYPERKEIERQYVTWTGSKKIAATFKVSTDGIYRHASATGLDERRQQNVRAALCRIIEHADEVQVNAYAVVQAAAALSRINARGQWIQRREVLDLNQLFDKMTAAELERYATRGELPDWFPASQTNAQGPTIESETETPSGGQDGDREEETATPSEPKQHAL